MPFYAVRKGRAPGIYTTWGACQSQVKGFPGAEFKKFDTEAEAQAFIGNTPTVEIHETNEDYPAAAKEPNTWVAYTDGSYNIKTNEYGAGLVLFHDDQKEAHIQTGSDPGAATMRNVAGEILAAIMAIQEATKGGAKKLIILHDYAGISCWPNHTWKAKNNHTQNYVQEVERTRKSIQIEFQHVSAHSGIRFNEEADALAKQASGIM